MSIVINGQPLSKMVYNVDNFKRLQNEVEELYQLVAKLNAELSIQTAQEAKATKTRAKK